MWKCLDCQKQFSVKGRYDLRGFPYWTRQVAYRDVDAGQLQERHQSATKSLAASESLRRLLGSCFSGFATRMHHGTFDKMTGTVEADETFIGGKARNMHFDKKVADAPKHGTAERARQLCSDCSNARPEKSAPRLWTVAGSWHLHNRFEDNVENGSRASHRCAEILRRTGIRTTPTK